MADRPDIDALLISALYGELTPADETRLEAHLESHPADRTALADLTRARAVVRESRILQFQFEPPQAVSALLLQEAARRVPRASSEEKEGWFARFVSSFAAHPAMAAAAMLVVVIGVATVVSKRGGDLAKSTAPSATQPAADRASEGGAPPADQSLAIGGADSGVAPSGGAGSAAWGSAAATDQYPVDLYTTPDEKQQKEEERDGAPRKEAKLERKRPAEPAADKPTAKSTGGTKGGIEVRSTSPQPKDFDAAPRKKAAEATVNSFADQDSLAASGKDDQSGNATIVQRDLGGAGGGARPGAAAPTAPPPPPPAPATATATTGPRATTGASEDTRAPDPALAWAREQHQSVITQVRAGNCRTAANLAVTLSNRAPGYYSQNVATDRQVKECLAYINNEVAKDAELRAQRERARRTETSKRAVDQPAKAAPAAKPSSPATSTESK